MQITEADILRVRTYNLTLLLILGAIYMVAKKSIVNEMAKKVV